MVEVKRVSYSFNSQLDEPYFLECFVQKDDEVIIDSSEAFKTLEEFGEAVEKVVPLLEDKHPQDVMEDVEEGKDEDWQD